MDKEEKYEVEKIADSTRRDFIKRFGSFAASAPLAGYILLTPSASAASITSSIEVSFTGFFKFFFKSASGNSFEGSFDGTFEGEFKGVFDGEIG